MELPNIFDEFIGRNAESRKILSNLICPTLLEELKLGSKFECCSKFYAPQNQLLSIPFQSIHFNKVTY